MFMKAALALVLGTSMVVLAPSALAGQLYPKVYDATYEAKSQNSVSTIRMCSDGKGKLRTESGTPAYKIISLIDYPGKFSYSILDSQKMIMKTPISTEYEGEMTPELAKKKKAQDLGTKDIAGHKCHGWKMPVEGGFTEVWSDEKAGITVHSVTEAKGYKSEMTLKTYSPAPPAEALFSLPQGYKVTSTGQPNSY